MAFIIYMKRIFANYDRCINTFDFKPDAALWNVCIGFIRIDMCKGYYQQLLMEFVIA